MASVLNARQLTGLDESHLVTLADGHRLQAEVATAFVKLQTDARAAGFELAIASSYRSFARQLAIWNGKASGTRAVHDDAGHAVDIARLPPVEQLHAILRFSALPGTSRHHWGTDLDVYDAATVPPDYQVQLSPMEVAAGGLFDPLHNWLDARMAAGESHGFFRPYNEDRGGVAPERWHLSYAPRAVACAGQFRSELLVDCWDCEQASEGLLLREEIEAWLPQLLSRYVMVPPDWCPAL
jgi:LAS superfamily LD-carboxypeptidase LdcB